MNFDSHITTILRPYYDFLRNDALANVRTFVFSLFLYLFSHYIIILFSKSVSYNIIRILSYKLSSYI